LIVKERSTPIKITYLEALLRRLPYDHPKRSRIEEDLFKRRGGYRGEKALDQFLKIIPLNEDFLILNASTLKWKTALPDRRPPNQ
jgi:hypothetical protein